MSSLVQSFFDYLKRLTSLTDEPQDSENILVTVKITLKSVGFVSLVVDTQQTAADLKKLAIEKFLENDKFQYYSSDSSKVNESLMKRFKLIRSCNQRILTSATITMGELEVEDGEEFVMIAQRAKLADPIRRFKPYCRITQEQIEEVTKSLESTTFQERSDQAFPVVDMLFADDMRKVFVTLAQESARVLGCSCYANKLIELYRQKIHHALARDNDAVAAMTQLGFKQDRVEYAMDLAAGNYRKALDWLIDNESPSKNEEGGRRRSSMVVKSSRRSSILSSQFKAPDNIPERVEALLEIVNFYADKDEVVYPDYVMEMLTMGYSMETAHVALKVTRNNTAAAVAYIEGERSSSIFEIRQGVSASSQIRKALLESPDILGSLSSPQTFEFFVNILHNPTQAREWDRNSDIGQLMTFIITTYHSAKQSMAINQFNLNSQLAISAIGAPNTLWTWNYANYTHTQCISDVQKQIFSFAPTRRIKNQLIFLFCLFFFFFPQIQSSSVSSLICSNWLRLPLVDKTVVCRRLLSFSIIA